MGTDVLIKSGEQTRWFGFGNPLTSQPVAGLPVYGSTPVIAAATSNPIYKGSVFSTFQTAVKGSGAGTLTATYQCTNDDDTGRGYVAFGRNTPGYQVNLASSTTMLSAQGDFDSRLNGALVVGPGIPNGTTATYVSPTQITLSQAATITQAGAEVLLYNTAWNTTPLGTVSITAFPGADGFTTTAPWRYVRVVYSAVTGTITGIYSNMGV